jgi:aromatic-L-amino-acid/L-tryptophan decarboxylase
MDTEEFRRLGHEMVDWIANYREQVYRGDLPVMPNVSPGSLRRQLPAAAPQDPEPPAVLLADVNRLILPACTSWLNPRFFGYFPSNSALAAVLGDMLSTGLGQIGLNWQASPALTELEETVLDWFRQMLGLSAAWSGVIQDTASTGVLVALICARESSTAHGATRGGLQGESAPLMIYTSGQSHSSVDKAALLAGFGRDNLRVVPVDENFGMRAAQLQRMIREDLGNGRRPCAVVATTGSTAVTAVDPLEDIAAIAREHNMWLHVDAALAGSAMILPECRHLWSGVEAADSLVINPHKWLGASFDCSTYYVRDAQHLIRVMSTNPSYLRTAADAQARSYRDWGIPLGRRFRALKLWFLIREQGVSGLQARLRRDLGHARWLSAQIDATAPWKRLAPVPLQTVCVRHEPPGLSGDALDTHTLGWVRRINESGVAYLTPALLDGRWMVRVAFGGEATGQQHVEQLWRLMQEEAGRSAVPAHLATQ